MTNTKTSTETLTSPRARPAGPLPPRLSGAVLHLFDRDILTAMATSLCASAAFRQRAEKQEWVEDVTPGDMKWAQCIYEQAAIFQGADIDRLIATADFRDPDARQRLLMTWGPEADEQKMGEKASEAETDGEAELRLLEASWAAAVGGGVRRYWLPVALAGAAAWLLVVLVAGGREEVQ